MKPTYEAIDCLLQAMAQHFGIERFSRQFPIGEKLIKNTRESWREAMAGVNDTAVHVAIRKVKSGYSPFNERIPMLGAIAFWVRGFVVGDSCTEKKGRVNFLRYGDYFVRVANSPWETDEERKLAITARQLDYGHACGVLACDDLRVHMSEHAVELKRREEAVVKL